MSLPRRRFRPPAAIAVAFSPLMASQLKCEASQTAALRSEIPQRLNARGGELGKGKCGVVMIARNDAHTRLLAMTRDKHVHAEAVELVDSLWSTCGFRDKNRRLVVGWQRRHAESMARTLGARNSLVYSWRAVVHFDRRIVRDYIHEFARVMRVGAKGFIQHSDLGDAASPDFRLNPQFRSNMSRDLFRQYCGETGLAVVAQYDLRWGSPNNAYGEVTDCISVFTRPR